MQITDAEWERLHAAQNSNGCYMLAIEEMRKRFMSDANPKPVTEAFRDKAENYLLNCNGGEEIVRTLIRRVVAAGRLETLTDGTSVFYCDVSMRNGNATGDNMEFSFVIPKE